MDVATQLEVGAHSLTAVLGVWLGLTVATRSSTPAARTFAFLTLVLATWSSSIVLQRLTNAPGAVAPARALEELAAAISLGATMHFSLVIATDGRPARRELAAVAVAYAVLLAFALPGILDRGNPVSIAPPHVSLGPVSGAVIGWAWVVARLGALALAAIWLLRASRAPDAVPFRRRQLRAALATVATGAIGASLRFLPGIGEADAWVGVSFVTLAVVFATYTVFSAGIFFGPAVADRAFRVTLLGGLALFAVVAILVGIETASRSYVGLDAPLFTALGLVVTVALYEPLAARLRRVVSGGGPRAVARERLLRALGQTALTAGPAAAGVEPALARLARALAVTGLAIAATDGAIVASEGKVPGTNTVRPIPLVADGELLGELRVGETVSGVSLDARDRELLELSAAYVAIALRTDRREGEQMRELTSLAEARAVVDSQATALEEALAEHGEPVVGLRVWALGPLRVERAGTPIERWGGDKAGSRQAQGLFAFLYDRGQRGVTKDEALELIWPDTDLERADLAFHRTIGGLRRTLDPDRRFGRAQAIRFLDDRYRLLAGVIEWSDVDEFLGALDLAARATDHTEQLGLLEKARRLRRGDFLDGCPFYGDSAPVEERRTTLSDRFADLVVGLGERYEATGDRLSAAAAFRQAIQVAPDGCPAAEAGLIRLGSRGSAGSP